MWKIDEVIPDLYIIRRGMDPLEEAPALEEELTALWQETGTARPSDMYGVSGFGRIGALKPKFGSIMCRIITRLQIPDTGHLGINNYPPAVAGTFHQDGGKFAVILQPTDGGGFDYAPHALGREQASEQYVTEEVNAGDIVLHSLPWLWHRGRNLSDETRQTAVIFFK